MRRPLILPLLLVLAFLPACKRQAAPPPSPISARPVPLPAEIAELPPLEKIDQAKVKWPGASKVETRLERLSQLPDEADSTVVRDVLQLALADADSQVRLAALDQLELLPNTQAAPLLMRLLGLEPVAEVRFRALDQVGQWKGPEALPVLTAALTGPNKDSKLIAISQLALRSDKPALNALFIGLNDSDRHVRELTNDKIEFLIDRRFNSYTEATQWFTQNGQDLDAELFRKE